jgi:hypothetical protein
VKLSAHATLERGVHHLVLGDPGFASEGVRTDRGPVMVAVSGQIVDFYVGIGESGA